MATHRLYRLLIRGGDADVEALREEARPHVAANALRQMAANTLQSVGDQVVNAKTVLPWLLGAVGAPAAFVAFLVPIRESGSMLPQAAWAPRIRRRRVRKWVWVAGAAGQAATTAALALLAATATGWAAGVGALAALAVFALSRSLRSLAGKDVLGRTVPKGQRGQIKGVTMAVSAAVALTLGVALRVWGGDGAGRGVFAALLAAAALAWVAGAAVYASVAEPPEPGATPAQNQPRWAAQARQLWSDDAVFRRFVTARGLLLATALSPPFVVGVGLAHGGAGLSSLGLFVIAQGVAGLLGGRAFGRLADASSRKLMIGAALAAAGVIVAYLALLVVPGMGESAWLSPAAYLLLALAHVAARLGRKTYVVDIADGDQRMQYVAVGNTLMALLLLVVGALTAALAVLGGEAALALLAALGVAGAVVARGLPEAAAR